MGRASTTNAASTSAPSAAPLKWAAGAFKTIHLENFMNHEHFKAEFCPHVNFITGANGSGKSALLTALCICLGAKARSTNRAAALKGFVRKGAGYALVAVTIYNGGADGYKPELYGDAITVVRRISETTGTTLTIRAGEGLKGDKVSSDRLVLAEMLEYFNIDVSNPLVIMSQDSAREILAAGDPKELFQFYMRATLLENVRYNISELNTKVEAMEDRLREGKMEVDKEADSLEALQAKKREYEAVQRAAEKIEKLRKQALWAHVAGKEREAAALRGEVETLEVDVAARTDKIEKAKAVQEAAAATERTMRDSGGGTADMTKRFEEFGKDLAELTTSFKDAKKTHMGIKTNRDAAARQRNGVVREIKDLESALEKERETLALDTSATVNKLQDAVSEARETAKAQRAECDKLRKVFERAERDVEKAGEDFNAADKEALRCQGDLKLAESEAKKLTGNNASTASFPQAAAIHRIIASNARAFSRPPVGPIGSVIKLNSSDWSPCLSVALKNDLDKFVCHNLQDAMTLRNLTNKDRSLAGPGQRGVAIVSMNFDLPPHTIPPARQPAGHLVTIYRVLQCEHAAVINHLVDAARIEAIVLEPEEAGPDKRAEAAAWGAHRQNVKFVVCADTGATLQMKGNSHVTTPWRGQKPGSRVGADMASMRKDRKAAVDEAKMRHNQATGKKRARQQTVDEAKKDCEGAKRARRSADSAQVKADTELETAMDVAKESNPEDMQAEVDRLAENLERERASLREQDDLVATNDEQLASATRARDAAKEEHAKKTAAIEELQSEMEQAYGGLSAASEKHEKAQKKLKEAKTALRDCEGKQAAAVAKADKAEETAAEYARRVEQSCSRAQLAEAGGMPRRTIEELSRDIQLEEQRKDKAENKLGGSLRDVEKKVKKQERHVERLQRRYNTAEGPFKKIQKAALQRKKALKTAAKGVATEVAQRFGETMRERHHEGMVKVSYTGGTLDLDIRLNVDTNKTSGQNPITNIKSLSGGEKSYATLSFALALGRLCDSPMRAMDEFDIFMDKVNRRVSTKALLKFAFQPQHMGWQFLLLTPQSLDMLGQIIEETDIAKAPDDVKVMTLKAPRVD